MDGSTGSNSQTVKKQEDADANDSKSGDKRDAKPVVKTLNRVPRACNACRKQKMRCEGADNPPCRRCRHANLECLFEKPSREATLTGEAGLERIRSLEAHVADIRVSQTSIQNSLAEIISYIRGGGSLQVRSPTIMSSSYPQQSPSMHSVGSTSTASPTAVGPLMGDGVHGMTTPQGGGQNAFTTPHGQLQTMINSSSRQSRAPVSNPSYRSPSSSTPGASADYNPPQLQPSFPGYNSNAAQPYVQTTNAQGQVLPPFSSIQSMGSSSAQQSNMSSVRYNAADNSQAQRQMSRQHNAHGGGSSSKRPAPSSSNVTSADSSDVDDDENGELPASGLVAPWEVLRGLADVAIERAAKENGDGSEPQSRARTPTPERQARPSKRRKVRHKVPRSPHYLDVVTKNIVTEGEARELFRIFYHGCSTFLPVFDSNTDTYDALHERSPFAVDCICMVAARVRDGGGKASETYTKCLEEVHTISCATLFSPVTRNEAVQAMILVSGWSDNGWLSGGHAVRMAMELSMHKAWPKLLKRMKAHKASTSPEDQELVIKSRTWFCLYLFEHQLSYGTGRPAVLKDDESIWQCRLLLQHPLAIEDDMRLVSTVELMAIRERVNNNLSPLDKPVDERSFQVLREADLDFRNWYATWDQAFSQKYEDAAFYRQSLQLQQLHAELFHNATALRGINGFEDVQKMPQVQRDLAIRSIQIARQGLEITVTSPAYREGMKYAVHYTHATATFAASFLLRLARLFPGDCDMAEISGSVQRLVALMSEIPGKRYALTLQLMLKRSKRRKNSSRSPQIPREPQRPIPMTVDSSTGLPINHPRAEPFSPTYDPSFSGPEAVIHGTHMPAAYPMQHSVDAVNVDNIWRGFEMTSNEQLPVWISDQSLGGSSFQHNGMDAFLLPNDYLPPAPQIW